MRHTICIIEDDPQSLHAIGNVISMSPHLDCPENCRFQDGAEALREIPKRSPSAVIVDLELGARGLDGLDCIFELREKLPATHLVVYTWHTAPARVFCALRAGAAGYIEKGSPAELLVSLTALCNNNECPPIGGIVARHVLDHFRRQNRALPELTAQEERLFQLLADGLSNKEAADHMNVSARKVDDLIKSCRTKLRARSREQALAIYAKSIGL